MWLKLQSDSKLALSSSASRIPLTSVSSLIKVAGATRWDWFGSRDSLGAGKTRRRFFILLGSCELEFSVYFLIIAMLIAFPLLPSSTASNST